jgi:hypothetical protein
MENGEHDLHPGHDTSRMEDDQSRRNSSTNRVHGHTHTHTHNHSHTNSRGGPRSREGQLSHQIPSPVSSGNRPLAPPPDTDQSYSANHSSRNSPEPAQTDRQGHYVGPSSGASFLLRIQRKLNQQPSAFSSDTSIFTFGDLPLPESNPRFLILPPRPEADALVSRYFEFASATHRFLHRPTVELWLQELYETKGSLREELCGRSKTALLFMVFACAENYPKSRVGIVDPKPG